MQNRVDINGVECEVYENFGSQGTRLFVPLAVNGQSWGEFAIRCFVEKRKDPEKSAVQARYKMLQYDFWAPRCLVHSRKFWLFYFSSPKSYPEVTTLFQAISVESLNSRYLENMERLIKWGEGLPEKRKGEILRRAIYRHPEWLPEVRPGERPRTTTKRALDELDRERLRMIAEGNLSLEEIHQIFSERALCIFTFQTEREFFQIVHQGMQKVYKMIKSELTPKEKFLFKFLFFKNSGYLGRVIGFDPSLLAFTLFELIGKVYLRLGSDKASRFFTPERVIYFATGFYDYYPLWRETVMFDEKDKRRSKKEISHDAGKDDKIVNLPDYQPRSFPDILAQMNTPYPYVKMPLQKPPEPKKEKRRPEGTFLGDRERKIAALKAEGLKNKEVARKLQLSPSQISKIWKAVEKKCYQAWRKKAYRLSLRRIYDSAIKRYNEMPAGKKELYKKFYLNFMEEIVQYSEEEFFINPKIVEKDLIPPCFRNGSSK